MEQTCYKCGAAVDPGRAFCPQCNAPQIRVAVPEPVVSESVVTTMEVAPSGAATASALPGRIDWSHAVRAAALAGIISSVLMLFPRGAFIFGMVAAGVLSVVLYRRRNPSTELTPGMGARLGALGGVVTFTIFAVLSAVAALLFGGGAEIRKGILDAINQAAARNPDAQAQQAIEMFKTPAGMAFLMVAGMVVVFIAFLVLSSLGGALAAVMMRRKGRG